MNNLVDFAKRVEEQLAGTKREPRWDPAEAERYMAKVEMRRRRFGEIAVRLNDRLIQPRLEALASYFPNASLTDNEPAWRCACWFGYCDRFPASTKVAFAVEHDIRFEKMAICYEASMMPVFIKLNQHDRLTAAIDEMNDDDVAEWIDKRLLEFLDAYLSIDRGGDEFEDEPVTDPVSGMRISRSSAAASDAYRGHPYYFCSIDCQANFARSPTAYVEVKTM